MIKFTCMISMHIMTEPLLYNALETIRFIVEHPRNFSLIWVPLITAVVKVLSIFLNEIIMATSTIYEDDDPINIVQNFSALFIV